MIACHQLIETFKTTLSKLYHSQSPMKSKLQMNMTHLMSLGNKLNDQYLSQYNNRGH